jgi:hypothetical protein
MKNISGKLFGILAMSMALFLTSCDPCKDVDCGANGTCEEGVCNCDYGFEGTNCESHISAKFVGNFNLSETCSPTGADAYQCSIIESSTDLLKLSFGNLYNASVSVIADIQTNGTDFIIASQPLGSATISGTGTVNATGTQVTVSYSVTLGGFTDQCTATLVRI